MRDMAQKVLAAYVVATALAAFVLLHRYATDPRRLAGVPGMEGTELLHGSRDVRDPSGGLLSEVHPLQE